MAVISGLLQVVQVRVIAILTEAILLITAARKALYHVPKAVRSILFHQGAAVREAVYHQDHIADHPLLQVIQVHQDLNPEALIQAEDLLHIHQVHHHTRQGHHQVAVRTAHQVVLRRGEDKLRSGIV